MAISKYTFIVCLLLVGQAQADEWFLQINGVSRHQGECRVKCNKNNQGIGIQRDYIEDGVIKTLTVGTLINSVNDRSYYAGAAYKYQFGPLEVGAFGGLIYYKSEQSNLWPATLPMVSLSFKHFGINAIYFPAIRQDVVPAWLFQLKISII